MIISIHLYGRRDVKIRREDYVCIIPNQPYQAKISGSNTLLVPNHCIKYANKWTQNLFCINWASISMFNLTNPKSYHSCKRKEYPQQTTHLHEGSVKEIWRAITLCTFPFFFLCFLFFVSTILLHSYTLVTKKTFFSSLHPQFSYNVVVLLRFFLSCCNVGHLIRNLIAFFYAFKVTSNFPSYQLSLITMIF